MGFFTDTEFDSTEDMLDAVNEVVERHVRKMVKTPAADMGLDPRCGVVYVDVDSETIAVPCARSIDYYGGFEYIKEGEGRTTMGDYTFYTTESGRVQDCFDTLMDEATEDETE